MIRGRRASEPSPATPARPPLWTRDYVLIVAALHCFFLAWSAMFTTLPTYLLDAPKWQIGWAVGGAYGVGSLLLRLHSGRLTDRLGRRAVMVAGGGTVALMTALLTLTDQPLALTPLRLLYGLGHCLFTTASIARLADAMPAARRGEGMGIYGVFYTATTFYGPWLGEQFVNKWGHHAAFLIIAGIVALGTLCAAALPDGARVRAAARGRLLHPPSLPIAGAFATLTLTQIVLGAFLVLFVRQESLGSAPLFFLVAGLVMAPARLVGGTLSDRFGRASIALPSFVLVGVGLLILAVAQEPTIAYLAAAFYGVGFGFGHTSMQLLTMDRAHPSERGAAVATFSLAWDIGTICALVLGLVGDVVNFAALFAVAGVLPLIAGVAFTATLRRGATVRPAPVGD